MVVSCRVGKIKNHAEENTSLLQGAGLPQVSLCCRVHPSSALTVDPVGGYDRDGNEFQFVELLHKGVPNPSQLLTVHGFPRITGKVFSFVSHRIPLCGWIENVTKNASTLLHPTALQLAKVVGDFLYPDAQVQTARASPVPLWGVLQWTVMAAPAVRFPVRRLRLTSTKSSNRQKSNIICSALICGWRWHAQTVHHFLTVSRSRPRKKSTCYFIADKELCSHVSATSWRHFVAKC